MLNDLALSLVVLSVCVSVCHATYAMHWGGAVCPKEDVIGSSKGATQYFRKMDKNGALEKDDAFAVNIQCQHSKFRQAAGLSALVWDPRLANQSTAWVKELKFTKECGKQKSSLPDRLNIDGFGYIGENVYWMSEENPIPTEQVPVFGRKAVETWVYEMRYYQYGITSYDQCPMRTPEPKKGETPEPNPTYEKFVQMMWDGTTSIGCDWDTCKGNVIVVVCRYSPGGLTNDQPVFDKNAFCRLNAMKGIENFGGPLVTCQDPATIDCKNVPGVAEPSEEGKGEEKKPDAEAREAEAEAESEAEGER